MPRATIPKTNGCITMRTLNTRRSCGHAIWATTTMRNCLSISRVERFGPYIRMSRRCDWNSFQQGKELQLRSKDIIEWPGIQAELFYLRGNLQIEGPPEFVPFLG